MMGRCGILGLLPLLASLAACAAPQTPLASRDLPFGLERPVDVTVPGGAQGTSLDRGVRLLGLGEWDAAYGAFIRALRTEPNQAAALTGAGVAAEAQGQLTRAHRLFELAVSMVPNSPVAHNNLGVVLYKQGRYAEANTAFTTAFALSSGTNAVAHRNLQLTEPLVAAQRPVRDPEVTHLVQRLGSSEYRLIEAPKTPDEG
jgi:Tfp pilus assembly protein PilF